MGYDTLIIRHMRAICAICGHWSTVKHALGCLFACLRWLWPLSILAMKITPTLLNFVPAYYWENGPSVLGKKKELVKKEIRSLEEEQQHRDRASVHKRY